MAKILVFTEFAGSSPKKGSLELLTAAKKSGNEVIALAAGPGAQDVATQLGHFGAKEVWVCNSPELNHYNPEIYTDLVSQCIREAQAEIVLASSSMLGKDLFPRVAARLDTGAVSDCTELEINGTDLKVRKPLYAGKCTAEVRFQNSAHKIILMRPNQLPMDTADTSAAATVKEVSLPGGDRKTKVINVAKGESEKIDLTEANVIVSGGRGMKGPEHFKLLDDLAQTIGATVGASRAVADAGWVPHSMQVGQTGKTVAPSLYIACGISGAIQHLAGMSGSKVIVAINSDPEAPIFQKATYGIVGDVFEVLPKLNEELKKLL